MKNFAQKIMYALILLGIGVHSYAQLIPNPEILYYKFDGSGTKVPNMALNPPLGTDTAMIMGGLTQGGIGQCGSALVGTGLSASSDYVNTNWAPNIASGTSWTISFWSSEIGPSSTLFYLFGDANSGSFRCFTNGVAGPNNWILRGTGITDVILNGGAISTPTMNTFVYSAGDNTIRAYLNGALNNTVPQGATPVVSGTGPFKVAGYGTSVGLPLNGLMDEFRFYNRALDITEIELLYNRNESIDLDITACDSLLSPDGNSTWTANGSYSNTLTNIYCGDSVVNINLTIKNSSSSSATQISCDSYVWPVNGTSYSNSGVYTATIPNSAGCDSTITLNLSINESNAGSMSASACLSYTWSLNGTTYTESGTYTATVPNAQNCDSTVTLNLSVNTPNASVVLSGATLTAQNTGAGVSYQWIDCGNGNAPIASATGSSFTPEANGSYAVEVTQNGCTNTSTCFTISNINIEESEMLNSISIFPNPSNGIFFMNGLPEDAEIRILNPEGKLIHILKAMNGQISFDLSAETAGIYFVKIQSKSGMAIRKIVKK